MDDQSTYEQLDALARMYLTGSDDEPQPIAAAQPETMTESPVATDAADKPAGPTLRLAAAPIVEAVLVGHLPGFANPWLSQYADELATDNGQIAVCHIDQQSVEIELVQPNPDRTPADREGASRQGGADKPSLESVLERLADRVSGWLIHLHEPSHESARAILESLDTWTLLSGAEESSVVGAYRLLKQLIDATPSREPGELEVQMMFMGCTEDAASRAAEKLTRTTAQFLHAAATHVGTRRQMQPIHKQFVAAFDVDSRSGSAPLSILVEFLTDLQMPAMEPPAPDAADWADEWSEPQAESPSEESIDGDDLLLDDLAQWDDAAWLGEADEASGADELANVVAEGEPEPEPGRADSHEEVLMTDADAESVEASPVQVVDETPVEEDGMATVEDDAAELVSEPDPQPSLTRYVRSTVGLAARCPAYESVELAVDLNGQLHMLLDARELSPSEAIMSIMRVGQWAAQHARLLALTCDEMTYDTDARPIAHIFCAEPRPYHQALHAGPAQMPPVRLHLLTPVTVGQTTTLYHTQIS